MRQAQARKFTDAYLDAPKRSERHLHAVVDGAIEDAPRFADPSDVVTRGQAPCHTAEAPRRVVRDLRAEAPAVDIPDWAEPFADARWDDDLGDPGYEERDGRRTVVVTGRPEGKATPRREATAAPSARKRRTSPTRARIAGRPDRVALWAVALGLIMAAMAGFSGNSNGQSTPQGVSDPAAAPLVSR